MRAIELFRLRRRPDRARAMAVLAAHAGLARAPALAVLHAALGGARARVDLPDDAAARACIAALAPCGFVARFAPTADFDPAECARAALAAAQPRLTRAVADTAGALLLHGEWELALDHALQHLRMHAPEHDAHRALLARTAIEIGLAAGVPGRA